MMIIRFARYYIGSGQFASAATLLFIVYSTLSCVTCCVSGVTLIVTKLFVTLAGLFCVTQ